MVQQEDRNVINKTGELVDHIMAAVQEHDSTVTDATDKTAQPDTAGA